MTTANALSQRMEGHADHCRDMAIQFRTDGMQKIADLVAKMGDLFDALADEFRKPPFGK